MSEPRKLYWDSSCFISFLNADEEERREICEDILKHARNNAVEIWTSTFTIVEVIRPGKQGNAPLPAWAVKALEAVEKEFPEARNELETLWRRHQSVQKAKRLTKEEIDKISAMFEWDYVKKINLSELIAKDAVKLARDHGLKAGDAIHAASAIHKKVSALQRWDRDFDRVGHLIKVEDPQRMSAHDMFSLAAAQHREKVRDAEAEKHEQQADKSLAADLPRGGNGLATGQAPAAPAEAGARPTDSTEGAQAGGAQESGSD